MRKLVLLWISILLSGLGPVNAQEVGELGPDFNVDLLSGGSFYLSEEAGNVVVIFFFGNTCPLCFASGPMVESSIYQVFKDHPNFTMVGLDTWDHSSSSETVENFKNRTGVNFPLGLMAGSIAREYKSIYDMLLVIDQDGILVHKGALPASNDIENVVQVVQSSLDKLAQEACSEAEISIGHTISHPTCPGLSNGSVDVMVSGDHPAFTYEWSTGVQTEDINGLSEGVYSLKVIDSEGCSDSIELVLSDPDSVIIEAISGKAEADTFNTYSYSVDSDGGIHYTWLVEGGTLVSGQGTAMVEVQWGAEDAGALSVKATSEAGCMSKEIRLDVTIDLLSTAIKSHAIEGMVHYPNPVEDILYIGSDRNDLLISIFDTGGRLRMTSREKELDLTGLDSGLYIIRVSDGAGSYTTSSIYKQ